MTNWGRRIRGALGVGLTWAVGWVALGLMIGITSKIIPGSFDWFFEIFDAPLPALAMPGFIGGALFSVVLSIAGRRRTFNQLSMPWFAALGAVGGLLLSFAPFFIVGTGLGTPAEGLNLTRLTATIAGPFMVFGAICAAGSLKIARRGERSQAESEPGLIGSSAEESLNQQVVDEAAESRSRRT